MTAATPTTGSLAGLTVIDLSRVLGGPYCTQILADHGADVLKIEPPQGDETRGWGARCNSSRPTPASRRIRAAIACWCGARRCRSTR